MKNITIALCWAAFILILAFVMQSNGVEGGASFTVICGLLGAALASLKYNKARCEKG